MQTSSIGAAGGRASNLSTIGSIRIKFINFAPTLRRALPWAACVSALACVSLSLAGADAASGAAAMLGIAAVASMNTDKKGGAR